MKRLLSLLLILPAVHAENVITTSFNTLLAGMTPEIANYLYAFILVFTVTQFALNMIPNLGQNSTTGIATAFGFGSSFFVYMTNYNIIGATIPFIAFIVLGILSLMVWNVYSQFRHSGAGWVAALISSIGLIILGSTMSKIGDFLTYDNSSGTAEVIASLSPYLVTFGILMAIASGIMAWRQLGLSAPGLPAVLRGGPSPASPGTPATPATPAFPTSPASPTTPGTTQPVNSIGIVGIPVPPIDTSGITEPNFVLESIPDGSNLTPNNISPDDGHFTPDAPGIYVIHVFAQGNTETPVLVVTFDITPRPAGPEESNEDTNTETPARTEEEDTSPPATDVSGFMEGVEANNNSEHARAVETSEGMAVEITKGEEGFAAFFDKLNPLTPKKVKEIWNEVGMKGIEFKIPEESWKDLTAAKFNLMSIPEGSKATIDESTGKFIPDLIGNYTISIDGELNGELISKRRILLTIEKPENSIGNKEIKEKITQYINTWSELRDAFSNGNVSKSKDDVSFRHGEIDKRIRIFEGYLKGKRTLSEVKDALDYLAQKWQFYESEIDNLGFNEHKTEIMTQLKFIEQLNAKITNVFKTNVSEEE